MNTPSLGFDTSAPQFQTSRINLLNGVVSVIGTNRDDVIRFQETSENMLRVIANFNGAQENKSFALSEVDSLYVHAQGGHDSIRNNTSLESTLYGGGGDDVLFGGSQSDAIFAGSGNDTARGREGDDALRMGTGQDVAQGGLGDDYLVGGGGSDQLAGNEGDDLILGGSGNDTLRGSDGDDILIGGNGIDWLNGNQGFNILKGQADADTLYGVFNQDLILPGDDVGDRTHITYYVDSSADGIDHDFSVGNLTLREAVNLSDGDDRIRFRMSELGPEPNIVLTDGHLVLNSRIEIVGSESRRITIDGNANQRIFSVLSSSNATIRNLRLTNGRSDIGGAIYVDGQLTLENSSIDNCTATVGRGNGGAIAIDIGGSASISASMLFQNQAFVGGAVHNLAGTLHLKDSTLADNRGGNGGAIYQSDPTSRFSLVNSTVSGNRADWPSAVTLRGGTFQITNSTIADNHSVNAGAGGGGLGISGTTGIVCNSIFLGNSAGGVADDLTENVDNSTWFNNFIGALHSSSDLMDGVNNHVIGGIFADNLEALADNGGGTSTHALKAGSQAIDIGDNVLAIDRFGQTLDLDQRGRPRIFGAQVDLGAYEYET